MPKRLIKKGVTVVRDGKRVRPQVGKLFDLTKEEIDGITRADAAALGAAKEGEMDGEATEASTSSAEASQAKAKGGKKAATANKSDAEVAEGGSEATDPPEGEGGGPGAGTDDDL